MDPDFIYLDYNATTPVDSRVVAAMRPFLEREFGNPSSAHRYGAAAAAAVSAARRQVARLIGCSADELLFVSGGSEANNHAIRGVAAARGEARPRIVTSTVEHPAVSVVCDHLAERGFDVTRLPVDRHGLVDPGALERVVDERTALVTVMHANNEVGTVEPIAELAAIAHRHGALMHSDCAQSLGKIAVDVDQLQVDLLSIAGHKLYAPKGVGALYVRRGVELPPLIYGAGHEAGRRAGTENVLGVVGLGAACELARAALAAEGERLRGLRDRLQEELQRRFPELVVHGHPQLRLPNTLSVSWPGVSARALLQRLDGVAASAGAACHGDAVSASATLAAMGVAEPLARGAVRFSVGRQTTEEEIEQAIILIAAAVAAAR